MNYKFINKPVFFPEEKILAISDLHIGFEEALNEAGIFVPRWQFKDMISELNEIFAKVGKLNEIIILGDLKHEFGKISKQEWEESLEILDYLSKRTCRIILVKGNHDTILGPIAERKGIEIKDYYVRDRICFLHGHKMFSECLDKKVKIIVMGHKHPAITIQEGAKTETYKCFLVGKWRGKIAIILPSFFPFVEGSNVIIEDTNLDFDFKLENFEAFLVEAGEVYGFGKVKDIGRLKIKKI